MHDKDRLTLSLFAALESLKQRVRELPADGEWHAMRDAVIALKNDLARGEW
jgi:hypothetical protein